VNFKKVLPEKDFKGRVKDGKVMEVSIHIFDEDCYAFQPFYKMDKATASAWMGKVVEFIHDGQDKCYAENALNDANDVDFADGAGKIDWNAALSSNERWLRSTIATQVGENAAVDEVFQDVALAAARQKAPIRDPRKIGAWLRRLATVYSLLYRRSLGRKKKLLQRYQDRVPPREAAGVDAEPLHWLLTEERRALVRQATALLADDERRVLTLKYVEDRSYKEIAEEIGATVSAVQSKLHRARARLREKLAELAPTTVAPPA
ncbi:MAG: sigma-70 family RNA polymerase sigma factor, partial [Thermoguttaceae bacterium]|nr:sigma-70 family RNA polymerase sigma factor [Thermoguttaceae bacterium]